MVANYDDAKLIVELARWGTEFGVNDALGELFTEGFDPADTSANMAVGKVLYYFEVIGTLVKQNVLSRDLVVDVWWIPGIWNQVKAHALSARADSGEPRLYENFEALVAL